jgi:hypothetical protein
VADRRPSGEVVALNSIRGRLGDPDARGDPEHNPVDAVADVAVDAPLETATVADRRPSGEVVPQNSIRGRLGAPIARGDREHNPEAAPVATATGQLRTANPVDPAQVGEVAAVPRVLPMVEVNNRSRLSRLSESTGPRSCAFFFHGTRRFTNTIAE